MTNVSTARKSIEQVRDLERLVENSLKGLERYCGFLKPFVDPELRDEFRKRLDRHFGWRPPRRASRKSAAAHEAGHFVIANVEKVGALGAEIYYSRGGPGGWSGHWRSCRTLDESSKPDELLQEVRIMLAGPLAEELFGDADEILASDMGPASNWRASENIEEIWAARFFVMRAAELLGCQKGPLWSATLFEAAARVESYGSEIRDVADPLATRKIIRDTDHLICWITERIRRRLHKVQPLSKSDLSPRCKVMIEDIKMTLGEFEK